MQEKLKDKIEQTQKMLKQNKEWQERYDKQVKMMLDSRSLVDQFRKVTKEYESYLQFYLTEVTQPDLVNISVKYKGAIIADVTISKDNMKISTENYNKSNKDLFNCDNQLKQEDFNSVKTKQFLNYFKGDIKPKGKLDTEARIESILLAEFSKTSSYDKLLTRYPTN